jgi:hypothetical protein
MASALQKRLGSPNGAEAKKVREEEATAQCCSLNVGSTAMVTNNSSSVSQPIVEGANLTLEVSGQLSNAVHLKVVFTSTNMSDNLASATHNVSASAEAGKSSESHDSDDDNHLVIDVSGVHSDSILEDVEPSDDDLEVVVDGPTNPEEKWVTKTPKVCLKATLVKKPQSSGKPLDCSQRTVYMTGRAGYKLARDAALKKANVVKAKIADLIGDPESLTICGESIRVVRQTNEQAAKLLKVEMILDKEIVVFRPKSHARKLKAVKPAAPKWNKGVIKRVRSKMRWMPSGYIASSRPKKTRRPPRERSLLLSKKNAH